MMSNLKDLWDFSKPGESEVRFREYLTGDLSPEENAEARTQLARSLGLQGKFDEGHTVLDGINREQFARTRVEVRCELERGRLFNSGGKPETAMEHFLKASEVGKACGEDELTADAFHMLAIAATPEEAKKWAARAIEYCESSDLPGVRGWLGPLHNNLGWTLFDEGDTTGALKEFEASRDAFTEKNAKEAVRIAWWSIARAYRSLDRHQEALKILDEQLKTLKIEEREDAFVYEEYGENLLALGEVGSSRYFRKALPLLEDMSWLVKSEPERIERVKSLAEGS